MKISNGHQERPWNIYLMICAEIINFWRSVQDKLSFATSIVVKALIWNRTDDLLLSFLDFTHNMVNIDPYNKQEIMKT